MSQRYIAANEQESIYKLSFVWTEKVDRSRFNKIFLLISNGSGNLVIIILHFERISEHSSKARAVYQTVLHQTIDKGNLSVFDFGYVVLDGRYVF